MATNEKVLNTRIQLKYDTLANWQASTFVLKAGEIAIAQVPTVEGSTLQPVMFKVGDGNKTFSQLDWASALAADVYNWAKQSSLPIDTTVAPEGKFVEGFEWQDNKLVPKFREFVAEINDSTKEKLDAPTTKAVKAYVDSVAEGIVAQGTVVAAGAKIDVAQEANTYTVSHEEVEAPTGTAGTGRTYLTGVTTDGYGHITGFTTATEEDQDLSDYITSTDFSDLSDKVTNLGESFETKELKVATAGTSLTVDNDGINVLRGEQSIFRIDGSAEENIVSASGQFANSFKSALNIKSKQTVVSDPAANGKTLAFIDSISQNEEGVITATKKNVNLDEYAKTADVVTNDEFTAFEGTNSQAIATAEQNAKDYVDGKFTDANLGQYTTEQEVKDIVDGVIAGAADSETYNSLTKLVDYIDAHGGEASEMAQAIDTLEGKVEVIEGKPAYGITATQISNWDNEVGAKEFANSKVDKSVYDAHLTTQAQKDAAQDEALTKAIAAEVERADGKYATEADLTLAENRIGELEKKPGLDKVGTVISVATGTGLTGGTITESGTIALSAETIASLAKADTALQAHQDISGKADKVTGATAGNFAGLDANGNLTDSGAKAADFATAAQGEKADTAVQPGELAAIAKTGNVNDLIQTAGDILVFNCGSASTVI